MALAKLQLATVKILQGDSKGLECKHEGSSLANQQIWKTRREVFQISQLS